MKNLMILALSLFIYTCIGNPEQADKTWIPLFIENSNEWKATGTAAWSFIDDEIVGKADSSAGFLITELPFEDFLLNLEFFPDATVNSGVFIRCGNKMSPTSCYEINIWDNHANQDYRTGALVALAKPLAIVETVGKWNSYKIKAKGNHIEAWVNRVQTVNLRDSTLSKGTIAIQCAGEGSIRFRNVRIQSM